MAKTEEELNELQKEYKTLTSKLKELTEDELKVVTGGTIGDWNNIEHSGINIFNQGQYSIYYGQANPTNENYIPLPSDEKLKP